MSLETLIEVFVSVTLLWFVFCVGVVYGLSDCPNITDWIKRKFRKK